MNNRFLNKFKVTIYSIRGILRKKPYIINIILFIATFLSCMLSGSMWSQHDPYVMSNWQYGLTYAILIMTFLSAHEFGHYFASRIHKVDATLPYFIPAPLPDLFLFGTFGAVIKTRNQFPSKKALFDIGVSGPIAGFVACVIFLIIGFATLPSKEFIYSIHPQYLLDSGKIPETGLHFGGTILFNLMSGLFKNPSGWLPPMNVVYHYPFLCVGWFGLFVTTMNMLPLGQLDGGHVTYAIFGDKQQVIAKYFWWVMMIIGFGAVLNILHDYLDADYPNTIFLFLQRHLYPALHWLKFQIPWYYNAWGGWVFWMLITRTFIKLKHPPIYTENRYHRAEIIYQFTYMNEPRKDNMDSNEKLDRTRVIIGIFAYIILILSFSYNGIYFL